MKDGTPVSNNALPNYAGANTSTLHITSFSPEHDGLYMCKVSNNYCSLSSDAAKLCGRFHDVGIIHM